MRILVATLALFVVAATAALGDDGPSPEAAAVEVPELAYDAGKVDQGTTIRHSFLLKNVGTAELSIDAKPG